MMPAYNRKRLLQAVLRMGLSFTMMGELAIYREDSMAATKASKLGRAASPLVGGGKAPNR